MKKKLTSVLLFLAMSVGVVSAQTSKVTGKVVGEDGEPVIGASIIVKGTTVGTVTDFDGNFTLDVPSDGKQLVISYIGMKSKEVVVSPNVNVTLMSDTQNLDEVVVTAMGISKEKKALGYAVQDVKSDELTQGANTSLSGALQGKVSGIDIASSSGMPGASSKIMIRGARSFTGDNSPLYVIDGMPIASTADVNTDTMNNGSVSGADYANRAVDLDPNDIESINILKGQAASALYGMRASNGVIVITTKSGKGARKGKPQISFNTNLAFDKVSTLLSYKLNMDKVMKVLITHIRDLAGDRLSLTWRMILYMAVMYKMNIRKVDCIMDNTMCLSVLRQDWIHGLLPKLIIMRKISSRLALLGVTL
ncbi:Outer membrane receptor for ferrienterochelin and colicins [Parabacteroides distasonis]|nr:Outer membrane receptor for ferrienterochelin and colicins [Parabacteroides distasonis]